MSDALHMSCGGVIDGVKSIDDHILVLIKSSNTPLRTNRIAETLDTPKRTIERALRRLKKNKLITFEGAPKTGGYVLIPVRKAEK